MEYMNLILQVFSAGLDFFTQLITADQFIGDFYFTLCFLSVLMAMFVMPFLGGFHGLGSDKVSKKGNGKMTGERYSQKMSSGSSAIKDYDTSGSQKMS